MSKYNKINKQLDYSTRYPILMSAGARMGKAKKILVVLKKNCHQDLKDLNLLDYGCSSGIISCYLGSFFKEVVGIDIDKKALRFAREHYKKKNVSFKLMNSIKTGLKADYFDIIICNHIYEHVDSLTDLIKEVDRLLKPDGFIYFSATNKFCFIEPHYNLPLLSWLPKRLANFYLRIFKRGNYYYENLLSYPTLRKKLSTFFYIKDETMDIAINPKEYFFPLSWKSKILSCVPPLLRNRLISFSPTWIFLLYKK